MRLYALLALCVCARAALALPHRNLDDLDNVDLDNNVSEPELLQPTNTIKDFDNSLRNAIPVKVIEDVKKIDENSNDYVPQGDSIDVKRAPIDLKNPGPPQRQEHETQNPEHYTDAQKAIFTIKQTIEDTQEVFTKGLKGISENFNKLFANNEQLSTIQENIQSLKNSFNEQVLKLNSTIKSYINPEKVNKPDEEIQAVETRLKVLESNFKSGVHTLSEGVELLAIIKEEDEAAKAEADAASQASGNQNTQSSTTTQAPFGQNNPVIQFLYNFQQGMLSSINGLSGAVQNYFNPGQNQNQGQQQQTPAPQGGNFVSNLFQGIQLPFGQPGQPGQQGQQSQPAQNPAQGEQKPPGVVADQPVQTGWRPPNIIQQVQNSWNNLVSGVQGQQQQQQQQQTNPLQQAFQNIVNVFQRPGNNQQPSSQAPNNAATQPVADAPQGVNVVPADPAPQQNTAQPATQPAQPQPQPTAAPSRNGPIQQLVQNNPIIKGLHTVATRITNPERPRDTAEENTDSKGHIGLPIVQEHNHSGDNSVNSRIEEDAEKIKEDKKEVKCEKEEQKKEQISSEPAKTE